MQCAGSTPIGSRRFDDLSQALGEVDGKVRWNWIAVIEQCNDLFQQLQRTLAIAGDGLLDGLSQSEVVEYTSCTHR